MAVLLALLICVTGLPVSAAAEATVSVQTVNAKAGETVAVPITVTHLDDIASIGFHVWYDPTVLKCVGAQMSDVVGGMNWASANTEPKGHPNEVWLTAISLEGVVLDGTVMTVTFEVLANAPAGKTPVKITTEGLSISKTDLREITVDAVDGGVMVEGDPTAEPTPSTTVTASTTTVAVSTTKVGMSTVTKADEQDPPMHHTTVQGATSASTQADAQATQTDADEEPIITTTTIELPEETVVDMEGNVVTDAKGEPTKVKAVAVMLSSATAGPEETVTITVSLSAVSDLTALGLAVQYDTDVFSFEGGECVGFIKAGAGMTSVVEHEDGTIDISATANKGLNGNGTVAELRFKVKASAKNGEYRLSLKGEPLLQTSGFELPVKSVTGKIRVEGAAEGDASGLYVTIGIVVAAAVVALIVWFIQRRKKAAPVKDSTQSPAVINVSGEDEE